MICIVCRQAFLTNLLVVHFSLLFVAAEKYVIDTVRTCVLTYRTYQHCSKCLYTLHYSQLMYLMLICMFTCPVRRQNNMLRRSCDRSTCKSNQSRAACTTVDHEQDENQACLCTSWCRSLGTLYHCMYRWTSLSRRMWTHDSGLYAVQQSRRRTQQTIYNIQLMSYLKIFRKQCRTILRIICRFTASYLHE